MSYDNTNRGQIRKNDKKEKPNQPDFTGTLNVEGVEYWVSAWKRATDANPKAPPLKFSIQKKEKAHAPAAQQPTQQTADDGFSDDAIPF